MTTFKIWNWGKLAEISIGDEVTVFRCGGGKSAFGEPAKLNRATKQHLVFLTESGAEVKTPLGNISYTVGKAKEVGYSVSLKPFGAFENINKSATDF